MSPLLTAAQVREVEAAFAGASPGLMARAGEAVARAARRLANDTGAPILVVAGPGNNGGDAWVAARHLREGFARVIVLDIAGREPKADEARLARERFLAGGGEVCREWPTMPPSLVIDGLLGIGLTRDVEPALAKVVARINAARAPVLAIDVPSGLDADTGSIHGCAVRATHTITFIARKPGLHTLDGPAHAGSVELDSLGVDEAVDSKARGALLGPETVRGWLGPRPRNSHKGDFGSVAIVGGNRGMVGAALLAARAALFAGAGKVFVGLLAPDAPAVDARQPELMLRPVGDVMSADAIVAGPGAGHSSSPTSVSMFERQLLPALIAQPRPLVLDADALNALASGEGLREAVEARRVAETVLTPHPAEAARLLGTETQGVQRDRVTAAITLADRFKAHVVLKGAGSVCAFPDGRWSINTTGNAGLASGGTGDVLAGMIGALLCQGLPAERALQYAVCLHGAAADALVARGEGPIGLTASELLPEARRLLNEWTRGG